MAKTAQQNTDCVRSVSTAFDADIYILSGSLYEPLDDDAANCIRGVTTKKPNALLVLTTFGGNAEVTYRIARSFQRAYAKGEFIIVIPGYCKSGGTLLAIGASRLIMTDDAQLGPLDVQIRKPDALGDRMSGLTPCQSLAFLQEHAFKLFEHCFLQILIESEQQVALKTAMQAATELTTGLMGPVYAHLDPMRLGEYHRDMMVAFEYGKRLGCNKISEAALKKLTHGYPSHEFIIDREEARELFKKVDAPQDGLVEMLQILNSQIQEDLYHQDATKKKYVGVIRFLNFDIDLTPNETLQKEVGTNETGYETQPGPTGTEQPNPDTQGDGGAGENVKEAAKTNTDAGGATDNPTDAEVVDEIKKAEENVESA